MAKGRPRFRRDLEASPIEIDGISYVDATDPGSGANFRFYDFEHAVAEVLDGRVLGEVVADAQERSGFELTAEQLETFTEKLQELGFLEAGDDDATHSGPAPVWLMESTQTAPVMDEDVLATAASAPSGGTEKLATLGLTGEKGPPVEEPPAGKQPPADEPPAHTEQPPVEEPPADEPAPIKEPGQPAPERKVTRELVSGLPPTEVTPPPVLAAGPAADPALAPRMGELRSFEPAPRPLSPSAELPPTEANVVAPDLADEEELRNALPSADEESTDQYDRRLPEDRKGTLFGVPFHEVDKMVASARAAKAAGTPPPVLVPKDQPPTQPAAAAAVGEPEEPRREPKLEIAASNPDLGPKRYTPRDLPSPPAESSPFPPAVEPASAPFPPAATPGPVTVPSLSNGVAAHASSGAAAVGSSSEVPALAPATPPPTRRRTSPIIFAGITAGVVAAAVIFFGFRLASSSDPRPISVRTIVPEAGSTFRWFDATGTVKQAGERTLTFTTGGKVIRVLGPGATFQAGDLIAEVEGAPQFKGALDHNQKRLAYYEQRLEQMRAENNRGEIRQAEIKIAEKKRLIAEAQAGLSRQGVIATTSGEIAEALVAAGAMAKAGAPAVKVKGSAVRAEFELSREDADRVRHLGFCRVEIEGKPLDCSLSAEGGDETHVFVDLPSDGSVAAGRPVRLAKARFDEVFVLPATALVPTKGSDRRVYVVRDGRAESYAVVLADQTPTEIVVSQGLEPGSAVVAEVPPTLRPRAQVRTVTAKE